MTNREMALIQYLHCHFYFFNCAGCLSHNPRAGQNLIGVKLHRQQHILVLFCILNLGY